MGSAKYQQDGDPRTSGPGFKLTLHPDTLRMPYRWRGNKLVFVNSMSDLFHPDIPLSFIQQVFEVMENTPQHTYQILTKRSHRLAQIAPELPWPSNIWMGVSVETPRYAFRLNHLREVDATVRFVSAEPLLEALPELNLCGIDWVIVGGESGKGSREMQEEWVQDILEQCADYNVHFFFKQWGGSTAKANGRTLNNRTYDNMPDRKSLVVA